jgi:Tol biopolymer transport system component/DNA-binding winged helix-turn-helix (wHTH) protein
MPGRTKQILAFGSYQLDPCEKLLRQAGNLVPLTPKAFDLLVTLVERRGQLVTKDQLMKLVWPESFVEETNLTHHISVLRSTLGEQGGPFIETVPRRGYRFVAVVEETEADTASVEAPVPADPVPARPHRRLVWLACSILGLCALGLVVWRSTRVDHGDSPVLRAVPLTSYPGMETFPTFSPDGNQVAFSWSKPGEASTDIYVQQVGSSNPLRLTDDPGNDWSPSWSPDGKQIAFVRWSDSATALMVMPTLPGAARKVTDLVVRYARGPAYTGTNLTWSPDSKWIVVADTSPDEPRLGLFLVSVETGDRTRLTSAPRGNDGAPAFSPDSRHLAFVRVQDLVHRELFMIRLSDQLRPLGAASQLTSLRRFVGSPVWTPDGREILFLSGDSQAGAQLWRIKAPQPGWDPAPPEGVSGPFENSKLLSIRFLRDGSARVAYMRHYFNPSLLVLDLKDPFTPAGAPRSPISSTAGHDHPQFSPDGRSIVFLSFRSGNPEIWKSDRNGSNLAQLTNLKGPFVSWPCWSPDSQWIAFQSGPEGSSDIYVMKSDGGNAKRLTHSPANEASASWSRDGRWIYFVSDRSGSQQVWKMRFEPDLSASPEEPVQVTKRGGGKSQESADGKTLYYLKGLAHASSLWSVPLGGGEERQVLERVGLQSFVQSPSGIYFLARTAWATPGRIQFLNSATGRISTVVDLGNPAWVGLSLSPDGRTLVFSQVEREESDLMMVENWRP